MTIPRTSARRRQPEPKAKPLTNRQRALLVEMNSFKNRDALFMASNGRRPGIWWWTGARGYRLVGREITALIECGFVDRISTSDLDDSAIAKINAKGRAYLKAEATP
jgi:hypothetical protein